MKKRSYQPVAYCSLADLNRAFAELAQRDQRQRSDSDRRGRAR
jgi:hypothetical protein